MRSKTKRVGKLKSQAFRLPRPPAPYLHCLPTSYIRSTYIFIEIARLQAAVAHRHDTLNVCHLDIRSMHTHAHTHTHARVILNTHAHTNTYTHTHRMRTLRRVAMTWLEWQACPSRRANALLRHSWQPLVLLSHLHPCVAGGYFFWIL